MVGKVLVMGYGGINLRQFAEFSDIATQHQDAFVDNPQAGDQFSSVSTKLKELGYDVIINDRQKAEFIPASRLGEVVGQRDSFKVQAESARLELEKLKGSEGMSPEAQKQIQTLIDDNGKLLSQLEETSISMELIVAASDAINPKDVAAFVDRSKVTVDKSGAVHGITEEVARIKAEKPYMFKPTEDKDNKGRKGGSDTSNQSTGGGKVSMNSMIRRATGYGSSFSS